MISEQEYIDCGDKVRVSHMISTSREIVPENSSVITRTDYAHIMIRLISWEGKLRKAVKVE